MSVSSVKHPVPTIAQAVAQAPQVAPDEDEAPEIKSLTADEVRDLIARNPSVSPWWVIAAQAAMGLVVALLAWSLTGQQRVGWSAAYGALAVVIPAMLFARGLSRKVLTQDSRAQAVGAAFGFVVWELVKITLTVAMLVAAPRLIEQLSWPAMLVGLLLTMKLYWVAFLWHPKRGN